MLTKKDFKAIAEIIKTSFDGDSATEFELPALAEHLADYLATKNPKFDREKFMKACGL